MRGILAQAKNGDNNFGNRNFMQPMGRFNMHLKCFDFFFKSLGGRFFHLSFVPNMFPMGFLGSLGSGRFLMCSPRVFSITTCFNPIHFAQSPPLFTYIGEPKGEALHLSIESSILGSFHSFNFFLLWANQMAHFHTKKFDL